MCTGGGSGRSVGGGRGSTEKWAEERQRGGNIRGRGFPLVQCLAPLLIPENMSLAFIPKRQSPASQRERRGQGGWQGKEEEEDREEMHPCGGLAAGVAWLFSAASGRERQVEALLIAMSVGPAFDTNLVDRSK